MLLLLLLLPILGLVVAPNSILVAGQEQEERVSLKDLGHSTAEILQSRGYLAVNYHFITSDGCPLNLVRANNPLVSEGRPGGYANKSIVLLLHGLVTSSQSWVINSVGARPQNQGHMCAGLMREEKLMRMLGDDPAANSFCTLLLNWGHEVWLLDRRPTLTSQALQSKQYDPKIWKKWAKLRFMGGSPLVEGSRRRKKRHIEQSFNKDRVKMMKLNLNQLQNNFDPRAWNFTFDHQALIDVPEVVDFILAESNRTKLSIVGHSSGSAITLMAAADGKLAREKVQHAMLWAPAMDMGHATTNFFSSLAPIGEPLFINYLGPLIPEWLAPAVQLVLQAVCLEPLRAFCVTGLLSLAGGDAGYLEQKIKSGFFSAIPHPIGSQELVQLIQSINRKNMYHFDYLSPRKNMIAYGQPKAPMYEVSRIDLDSVSIWTGNTDNLVTPFDSETLIKRMNIPVEYHQVGGHHKFMHYSFLIHHNISGLLHIPSLKTLERADLL